MNNLSEQSPSLEELFRIGRKLSFKKSELILRAGEEPRGVYLIEEGFVKIYSLSLEGVEHIHVIYKKGDIFPLIWAFQDAIRNVYYEAVEEVVLWQLPKQEFLDHVTNTALSAVLLKKAVEMFNLYAGRLDNLLFTSSYDRVAYRLLSLLNRFGKHSSRGWVIDAPLTHQHIANSINLTRETTSRVLERFQKQSIVGYDKHRHFVILDSKKLVKILGEEEVQGTWPRLFEKD